jgi:hypothetical protein
LFVPGCVFSQKKPETFKFFGIRSYSGELMLRGSYRDRDESGEKVIEKQQSYYYSGGILLNANTYLLHPNFCEINLGAGYMPESNRDNFVASPDQAEVRSVKKLNINAGFFSQKKINFSASALYDESYAKRENLTDIKTITKNLGGSLNYNNKYIPVNFDFFRRKLIQTEIQTRRVLKIDQIHFEGTAQQSFTRYDKQLLTYSHNNYSNLNENNFLSSNIVNDLNFNSNFAIGEQRVFTFNTTLSNMNQYGSFNFNRFQAIENLVIKLPVNFLFSTSYNYYNISQLSTKLIQQSSLNSLSHKLFKSLDSRFFFEYNTINHTQYAEYNSKTGFDFNYSKKTQWGQLNLSYTYFRYHQNYTSISVSLNIANEDYLLTDSKIVLLKRPYINIQTVVVKDVTGTIIYQAGLDYILIERGKYIEIRRIPSGLITNGGSVYVDYTVTQPSTYKYDADDQAFAANVSLFKGKADVYYRLSLQSYKNLENTDNITLNYFTQNVVGFRLGYDFLSGGAEFENYKSSILPYRMFRYYLNFQKNFKNKLTLALNGNMQNYTMLNEPESRIQRYADVAGKVEYVIVNQTKVNLDVMYRKQSGRGIDLDLVTARLEFSSVIYQLFVTAGVEVYRRNYIGDKINFKGIYMQILRKF